MDLFFFIICQFWKKKILWKSVKPGGTWKYFAINRVSTWPQNNTMSDFTSQKLWTKKTISWLTSLYFWLTSQFKFDLKYVFNQTGFVARPQRNCKQTSSALFKHTQKKFPRIFYRIWSLALNPNLQSYPQIFLTVSKQPIVPKQLILLKRRVFKNCTLYFCRFPHLFYQTRLNLH